jgi:hypothetical protein
MDFRKATDELFDRIRHADLAKTMNVSVAAVRQARLNRTAKAYREPPKGWEKAIIRLAQERISQNRKLVGGLKRS